MAEEQKSKFHLELWSEEHLRLTEDQKQSLPRLQDILGKCSLPIAETLRECQASQWTQKEMRALEHVLLEQAGKGKELIRMFDMLGKVVARHRGLTSVASPFPRSIHPVRLEESPFHCDVVKAEHLLDRLQKFLLMRAEIIVKESADNDRGLTNTRMEIGLAILSCIVHFHLLHESMLVALIETLADRENFLLHPRKDLYAYLVSLAWHGEADSERRMFLPDIFTGTLLVRIQEKEVRELFAKALDSGRALKLRHSAILAELEDAIRTLLPQEEFDADVTLRSVLDAGRAVAYLHLPATIAALRCRKSVSHAPRSQVLQRLFTGQAVGKAPATIHGAAISDAETRELAREISDISKAEPKWMQQMRDAFGAPNLSRTLIALVNTRENSDPAGSRIADFAHFLLVGKELALSTAKRYSLLIARRLGCRVREVDPATMDIAELEDLYREVLDDDWEDPAVDAEEKSRRRNKRTTVESLLLFHRYLQRCCDTPPLQELGPILKRRGLLPVDANFITVDEYLRVLAHISGPHGIDDPYLRSVVRLNVIIAFRCGLRRCEAFYLRAQDIDAAGYLYIRTYDLRKVKTLNSNRAVPASIFLAATEMSELRDFLLQRQQASRSGDRVLLFSHQNDSSMPLHEKRVAQLVNRMLRAALQDRSLRMHHLRHSFATLLAAKLLPNCSRFAADFLHLHPETLRWIGERECLRNQLFGTFDVRRLDIQAIAHLLGHGSPATSVEHYVHSLDWLQEGSN